MSRHTRPNPALEPTTAGGLHRLAVLSSPRAATAAQREHSASIKIEA